MDIAESEAVAEVDSAIKIFVDRNISKLSEDDAEMVRDISAATPEHVRIVKLEWMAKHFDAVERDNGRIEMNFAKLDDALHQMSLEVAISTSFAERALLKISELSDILKQYPSLTAVGALNKIDILIALMMRDLFNAEDGDPDAEAGSA